MAGRMLGSSNIRTKGDCLGELFFKKKSVNFLNNSFWVYFAGDIHPDRGQVFVKAGKGKKDRYTVLSPKYTIT
jgi:hypothetical protein